MHVRRHLATTSAVEAAIYYWTVHNRLSLATHRYDRG